MRLPILSGPDVSATYAIALVMHPEQNAPARKRATTIVPTVVLITNSSCAQPYTNVVAARTGTRPTRSESTPQNGASRKTPRAIAA